MYRLIMNTKKNKKLPISVTILFFGILLASSLLFNALSIVKIYERGFLGTPDRFRESFFVENTKNESKKIINNRMWVQIPDPIFNMYIIHDKSCTVCPDLSSEEGNSFLSDLFPTANIRTVDSKSESGKKLIHEGITSVPAIVLSPGFSLSENFTPLINSGIIAPLTNSKYFVLQTTGNKKLVGANAEAQQNGITIFHDLSAAGFLRASKLKSALEEKEGVEFSEKIVVRSAPDSFLAEAIECGVESSKALESRPVYTSNISQELGKTTSFTEEEFQAIAKKLPEVLSMTPKQEECFISHQYSEKIQMNAAQAARFELNDLPSFIVRDVVLSPGSTTEEILSVFADNQEKE